MISPYTFAPSVRGDDPVVNDAVDQATQPSTPNKHQILWHKAYRELETGLKADNLGGSLATLANTTGLQSTKYKASVTALTVDTSPPVFDADLSAGC